MKLLPLPLAAVLLLCTPAVVTAWDCSDDKINCKGPHLLCGHLGRHKHKPSAFLTDLIKAADERVADNATFVNNQHAACVRDRASFYSNAGLCAIPHATSWEGITGKKVKYLLHHLESWAHCKRCGNIPVAFPDKNDNRLEGLLTVTVVEDVGQQGDIDGGWRKPPDNGDDCSPLSPC